MIELSKWVPADGFKLEPNAMHAATEQLQCLALTAGPGAGKTEMLAQRADCLLRTGTCRYPKRILAISFKVDASKNLKERVHLRCGIDLSSRFDSYTFHAFAKRIIDRFRPILTGADALEAGYTISDRRHGRTQIAFGDLVPLATQILTDSTLARNAVRQTYSDVFLDEFQDCTGQQYQLIKIAFHGTSVRLTAVGDTKQKIMGWAGALDGIFQYFATDFNALPLNMYRNFRSKPRLLRMQNEIIRALDPEAVMPDEQVSGNEGIVNTWTFKDSGEEADYLANQISDWLKVEKIPPSEIAILVSKQLDLYASDLMTSLSDRNIPYRNEQQLQDISSEPVAQLIIDYLSCLYSRNEPKSWIRLVNLLAPLWENEAQSDVRRDIDLLIKNQRQILGLEKKNDNPQSGWRDATETFLNQIGTESLVALSPDYESQERLNEVVQNTMDHINDLMSDNHDLLQALASFADDESVRILTIHKSKGLEFNSVIIIAIDNEIFWGDPDENRYAFFVGVSRAKKRLALTYATRRAKPSGHTGRWEETRTVQEEFFSYAN